MRTVAAVGATRAGDVTGACPTGAVAAAAAAGACTRGADRVAAAGADAEAPTGASGWLPVLRRRLGGGGALATSSAPMSYGALRAWPSMSSPTSASTVPASIAGLPADRRPFASTAYAACLLLASTLSALRHCDRLPWLKPPPGRPSRNTQPLP